MYIDGYMKNLKPTISATMNETKDIMPPVAKTVFSFVSDFLDI